MKTINVANTEIDIHLGNIGISASGGADSGILIYLLMANLDQHSTLHTFTCTSPINNLGWPEYINRFVAKCSELTGFTNVVQHTYTVPEHTPITLMKPLYDYVDDPELNLRVMYTGVTADPPDDVGSTFVNPSKFYDRRNPNVTRPVYYDNRRWYTPFWNSNKKSIAKMYEESSVTDQLFHLTRSCNSQIIVDQHCGKCWWCEERQWAFGKL